jgi:hypothetical protein
MKYELKGLFMSILDEIKPVKQLRIMDLVRAAGVDVSDWANSKSGTRNPKYCYEWSFVEAGKLIVLNLWHESMYIKNGSIEQIIRESNEYLEKHPTCRVRWQRMKDAISLAYQSGLPVRVIVLDHKDRKSPKTNARFLDPIAWAVASIDNKTGEIILRRGTPPLPYVDQFSLPPPPDGISDKREIRGTAWNRSPEVRRHVLFRAKGKCEYCNARGFRLTNGSVYLETHHVIPLAQGGKDCATNVAALCPNHHREAHYGEAANQIKRHLLDLLVSL